MHWAASNTSRSHTDVSPALVPERVGRHEAGRPINQLRRFTAVIVQLPEIVRSPDPADDYLLALAEGGSADDLVTGDKAGLLLLRRHGGTRIVTARVFARLI